MTREQAVEKVYEAGQRTHEPTWTLGQLTAARMVDAFEALGLLKLEEPAPKTITVPCLGARRRSGDFWNTHAEAIVREDTLIETLRMAGYEVSKR